MKLANQFNKKANYAANVNLFHLQDLLREVLAFCNPNIKALYATAAGQDNADIYDTVGSSLDEIFNQLKMIALNAKNTVDNYGLNQSGYAGILVRIKDSITKLESLNLVNPLDPTASNKLGTLKTSLDRAESDYVPTSIPAQNPKVVQPVKEQPTDMAYNPENVEQGSEDEESQASYQFPAADFDLK